MAMHQAEEAPPRPLPSEPAVAPTRPWPRPTGRWALAQVWSDLLFAHWPVAPEALRGLIPSGLTLETFEGDAWIGVVPFRMSGVRPRWSPAAPWLSAFPELNVRTYVAAEGRPGVWFFSLDAGNPVAVAIGRRRFRLPYYRARMSITPQDAGVRYACTRTHAGAPPALFRGSYRPAGPHFNAEPGSLDHWLIERYCLYAATAGDRLLRAEVDHPPWDLHPAEAEIEVNMMARAAGIDLPDPDRPPLLHFARRQPVVAWAPRVVGGGGGRGGEGAEERRTSRTGS
jgi:uncharacterized protein YqjF (DUF2071 family)